MVRKIALLLILLAAMCGSPVGHAVAAEFPEQIRINQLSPYLPEIKAYVQLLDEQGEPVSAVETSRLSLRVDGVDTPITKVSSLSNNQSGTAYTILLDISRTVSGGPFQTAIDNLIEFVDGLSPEDKVAIGTFGDKYDLVMPFTGDKDVLKDMLVTIEPTDNMTVFYSALSKALDMNKVLNPDLPVRRAIMVVSDGKDEGSGLTLDDVLDMNRQTAIPIYSVGYTRIDQKHLFGLKRLSEISGGMYLRGGQGSNPFMDIMYTLGLGVLIEADVAGKADGAAHVVQVLFNAESTTVSEERRVAYLYVNEAVQDEQNLRLLMYGGVGGGVFLILLVVLIVVKRNKARREAAMAREREAQDAAADSEPSAYDAGASPQSFESDDSTVSPGMPTSETANLDPESEDTGSFAPVQENRHSPNCVLVVISDIQHGQRFEAYVADKGITVGAKQCAITMANNEIEDIQFGIVQHQNRFVVKHLAKEVSTHLNGVRVDEHAVLGDDDVIDAGTLRLRFKNLIESDF